MFTKNKFSSQSHNQNKLKGQLMITTVFLLGGVIISAASLFGLLIVYKLRQASDIENSAQAIFAAKTGEEWQLLRALKTSQTERQCPDLPNTTSFKTITNLIDLGEGKYDLQVISIGKSKSSVRILRRNLGGIPEGMSTSGYPVAPAPGVENECFSSN